MGRSGIRNTARTRIATSTSLMFLKNPIEITGKHLRKQNLSYSRTRLIEKTSHESTCLA